MVSKTPTNIKQFKSVKDIIKYYGGNKNGKPFKPRSWLSKFCY